MAWQPVELACPSCGETVRTDVDTVVPDGGGARLRGRELACRDCRHQFEVYYL